MNEVFHYHQFLRHFENSAEMAGAVFWPDLEKVRFGPKLDSEPNFGTPLLYTVSCVSALRASVLY